MRKKYIAPECVTVRVNTEGNLCNYSIDNTGGYGDDGEQNPVIGGNPNGDNVGAKDNGFGGGVGIWDD